MLSSRSRPSSHVYTWNPRMHPCYFLFPPLLIQSICKFPCLHLLRASLISHFPPSPLPSSSSRSPSPNKQSSVAPCLPSPVPNTGDTWRNHTGQRSQPSRRLCYLDLLPGSPLLPHKPLSAVQLTFPQSNVIRSFPCTINVKLEVYPPQCDLQIPFMTWPLPSPHPNSPPHIPCSTSLRMNFSVFQNLGSRTLPSPLASIRGAFCAWHKVCLLYVPFIL